jgi:hypothetical protein
VSRIAQLSILSGELVGRKRSVAGGYVGGRYVGGAETLVEDIHASVQPPASNSKVVKEATEGQRLEDIIVVYCNLDTFRTADDKINQSADSVVYLGSDYEVKQVTHRRGRKLQHDVVVAVREPVT